MRGDSGSGYGEKEIESRDVLEVKLKDLIINFVWGVRSLRIYFIKWVAFGFLCLGSGV